MFSFFRRTATTPAPIAETTETASVSEAQSLICPILGIPYGEPGSAERVLYIFAEEDYDDEQERQLLAELDAIKARQAA
ncbi:hypothetical protein [Streptomyces sp. NPDC058861]|uniref:hypothetical protein n=1 Tax=Streptomyces sp. NPDC058861 TaxID=3346653 RepID=UPI00367B95C3